VRTRDLRTGRETVLDASGVFVAIGHDPRVELVTGQVNLDRAGYIEVEGRSSRTNLDGVFACGDVLDHEYMQAITAAGSGSVAALDAERYLTSLADTGGTAEARVEAEAVARLVR